MGDGGIYERRLTYNYKDRTTMVENSLGHRTMYRFNEFDQPLTIINALGGTKYYSYSLNGELVSETDELGRVTKYSYDGNGNCTMITRPDQTTRVFKYNTDNLPEKLIDEAGAEFRREYDDRGNITAKVDIYWKDGKAVVTQRGAKDKIITAYDNVGHERWSDNSRWKKQDDGASMMKFISDLTEINKGDAEA